MELRVPDEAGLTSYADALRRRWSPNTVRAEVADEHLALIEADPVAFVRSLTDPEGAGDPITLADGSKVPRLPGYSKWLWDGEFCGSISLRWQDGTVELPSHVLGHIGYSVVPWKRRRGYATKALALILPDARALGLPHVELTTDHDNIGSQRVIEANGGRLIERFMMAPTSGAGLGYRYHIDLA